MRRGLRGGLPPPDPKEKALISRHLETTCNMCDALRKTGDRPTRQPGALHKELGQLKLPSLSPENLPDIRQVTFLSKVDWDRINHQLHLDQIEKERVEKVVAERQKMKDQSAEIVGRWETNTLAAEREQKLEARRQREKMLQEEMAHVDLEWNKQMAEERRVAIEIAKREMYYQTDRVKSLHGALTLVECLKEREAQMELQKLRKAAAKGQEDAYLEELRRANEISLAEEKRIAEERKEALLLAQKTALEHISERQRKRAEEMEMTRKESSQQQKLAIDDYEEHIRHNAQRKEKQRQMQLENLHQIEDCKRMRELNKKQEEEEDEESRDFSHAKRNMLKLRAAKEKSLRDEKLACLEALRKNIEACMKKKADDEDARIRRAEEEKEAKRVQEEKEKEERNQRRMAEFFEHLKNQERRKAELQEEESKNEEEALRIREEADREFRQKQTEKQQRRKQAAVDLTNYHKQQAAEKLRKEEDVYKEDVARSKANMELMEEEERMFQEYAQNLIKNCEERGRNVYPLRKAAQPGIGGGRGPLYERGSLRPSYVTQECQGVELPTYGKESTEVTKRNLTGKFSTKERLGFVWSQ